MFRVVYECCVPPQKKETKGGLEHSEQEDYQWATVVQQQC